MIYKMFHVKHFIVIKSRSRNKNHFQIHLDNKIFCVKIKNDFLLVMVDIKGYFKR